MKPEEFSKLPSLKLAVHTITTSLERQGRGALFRELGFWEAIDQVIQLADCQVYTFQPDPDSDPLQQEQGTMYCSIRSYWC